MLLSLKQCQADEEAEDGEAAHGGGGRGDPPNPDQPAFGGSTCTLHFIHNTVSREHKEI